MNFKEYQELSRKTAIYPNLDKNFIYPTLGLAGETGEVVENIKKVIRDKNNSVDKGTRENLEKELGDVLWYLAQLATELNISLDKIASKNIKKLKSRLERNVIHGEADNR